MIRALPVLLFGCTASTDKATDDGDIYRPPGSGDSGLATGADPEPVEDTGEGCGEDHAPVLGPIHTETEYILEGGAGEPIIESLRFSVRVPVADLDGDLHRMRLLGWMEIADDGEVEVEDMGELQVIESEQPCSVETSVVGIAWVGLPTLPLPYETAYDLGFQVVDAAGHVSEPAMATIVTPGPKGVPPGMP